MGYVDDGGIAARFRLTMRCGNCAKRSSQMVDVPDVDDAPTDTDSLLESALLARVPFHCSKCEYPIGVIVGVSPIELP